MFFPYFDGDWVLRRESVSFQTFSLFADSITLTRYSLITHYYTFFCDILHIKWSWCDLFSYSAIGNMNELWEVCTIFLTKEFHTMICLNSTCCSFWIILSQQPLGKHHVHFTCEYVNNLRSHENGLRVHFNMLCPEMAHVISCEK